MDDFSVLLGLTLIFPSCLCQDAVHRQNERIRRLYKDGGEWSHGVCFSICGRWERRVSHKSE